MLPKIMLATPYQEDRDGRRDFIMMPKFNGVRARYIPGIGFISRDRKAWHPGKLAHIEACIPKGFELDGELYVHGWSLQRINSAVSINSPEITDDTLQIQYHVYDLPGLTQDAKRRMQILDAMPAHGFFIPCQYIEAYNCCHTKKATIQSTFLARGYEGAMLKTGQYVDGKTSSLLKWKRLHKAVFKFVGLLEGVEGKRREGMVGALIVENDNGDQFKVGTGFSDALAYWWWTNRHDAKRLPVSVSVFYADTSDDGIPLAAAFKGATYHDQVHAPTLS